MDWTALLAFATGISGIILGWIGRTRAFKQEITQEATSDAVLRADVGYIKAGVDDVRLEQRQQRARFDELSEKVARVDESAKQAHKRIDRLEGGS